MKIYDISFNQTTCSNIVVSQSNTCTQSSTVSTVSNEPTTLITNIGLTYPGRIAPLKPISANESNSIYGFNTVGMSEIDPCFGWACSNTLKICGNVEICKNLLVHGHTQLVDTSVNNLEVSGNLVVDGHSWLQDTSTNNLDVSGNLEVLGHTRVCDLSACNVDISQNLEVFGHTQLVDVSCATLQCDASSTVINGRSIVNDYPATDDWKPNFALPPPDYGMLYEANNLYFNLVDTTTTQGGRGMVVSLSQSTNGAFFRVVDNVPQNAPPYLFEVAGDGITQTQTIRPYDDILYDIGKPTLRFKDVYFRSLFVTDISAIDISATNLTATNLTATGNTNLTGHLIFEDASGANLDISQNLSVAGEMRSTSWLQFADASGGKLYVGIGLEVPGTTVLSGHLDFKDASGDNLRLDDSLDMGGDIDMNLNDIVDASNITALDLTLGRLLIPGTLSVWDGSSGTNTFKVHGNLNQCRFGGYYLPSMSTNSIDRVIINGKAGHGIPGNFNDGNVIQVFGGIEILPNWSVAAPVSATYGANISLGRYGFDTGGLNTAFIQQLIPSIGSIPSQPVAGYGGTGNIYCNRIREQIYYANATTSSGGAIILGPAGGLSPGFHGNNGTSQYFNRGDVKYLLIKASVAGDGSPNTNPYFTVKLPSIGEGWVGSTITVVKIYEDTALITGNNGSGSYSPAIPVAHTPVLIEPATNDYFNVPNTVFLAPFSGFTVGALVLDPYNVLPNYGGPPFVLPSPYRNIASCELLATQVGDGMGTALQIGTTHYAWHMISRVRHI